MHLQQQMPAFPHYLSFGGCSPMGFLPIEVTKQFIHYWDKTFQGFTTKCMLAAPPT
jgi:hypothetical protein